MEKVKTNAMRALEKAGIKSVLDSSCKALSTIIVSAGKIGYQIEVAPEDLVKLINCRIENIIMKSNF